MKLFQPTEEVVRLEDFPQSSPGSPAPVVFATEHGLILGYYLHVSSPDTPDDFDPEELITAVIRFEHPTIHLFGPPNDEVLHGHRLARKGLESYGAFEIINSEWIRQLERANSVHKAHDRDRFMLGKRHFVITFHDSTFECVAKGYSSELSNSELPDLLSSMANSFVENF